MTYRNLTLLSSVTRRSPSVRDAGGQTVIAWGTRCSLFAIKVALLNTKYYMTEKDVWSGQKQHSLKMQVYRLQGLHL